MLRNLKNPQTLEIIKYSENNLLYQNSLPISPNDPDLLSFEY